MPAAVRASATGPLASYRRELLQDIGLTPLASGSGTRGQTEAHLWLYGPFGGMELIRLQERGGRLRVEAIVFVDYDSSDGMDSVRRSIWQWVEQTYGCRLQPPTAQQVGTCRPPIAPALARALRDSLARLSPDDLQGGEPVAGMDGGWLIVERRRGSEYTSYAYWAPYRALSDSTRTAAKALLPFFGRIRVGGARE